ncbi:MAG: hypothetical protein KatS3mg024_1347 [Armatimonadota bacterium]|nr:MAG: hypothetical protein KatS3mg024_1347 [Armatimonadota bacterium]
MAAAIMVCAWSASAAASRPDPVRTLPSAVIDPGFAWFSGRSDRSIAEELKHYGFRSVRYIAVRGSAARSELVRALHAEGLPVILSMFGNGVYTTNGLPEGWESWKMRQREGETAGYTYLCLNEPAYRDWKKREVVEAVKRCGFDAVEIVEPFWPAHGGPEKAAYGCVCSRCLDRFRKETQLEPPEFNDTDSQRFWRKDAERYRKWVDARAAWLTEFLDELINGKGGLRESCPGVRVLTWGIASRSASPDLMREWEGVDGAAIARRVRPDGYVVQTDWPDWLDPELPADYVTQYEPYIRQVGHARPGLPMLIQTDLGSDRKMLRPDSWINECDEAARKIGALGVFGYMHSLQRSIYTAPLRLLGHIDEGDTVRIILNKWPAPEITRPDAWKAQGARVASVERDGCTLVIRLEGRRRGNEVKLSWKPVTDDPSKRWFRDVAGPCAWEGPTEVSLKSPGPRSGR